MNYQLIKNGCQSFFDEVGIEIDNFDEVVNEVYEIIKEIREDSPDFYDYICESNKFTQLRGLYLYLSERYEMESESVLFNSPLSLEEGFLDVLTSPSAADSVVWSTIFKALTSVIGFFATGVASLLKVPLIIFAIILATSINYGRYLAPDKILEIFNTFGKALRSTGEAISNLGKTWTYRYAFVMGKFNDCAPRCNIKDISDLRNSQAWKAIKSYGQAGDKEMAQKIECLVDCFFANLIELIALNVRGHMTCLLNINKMDEFKRLDSKEILQKIRTSTGSDVDNPCYVYFDISKKLMDTLEEAMDVAFKDRPQNKKRILDLLDKQIFTAKKEVEAQVSRPQFQRRDTQFQKK